MSSPLVSIVLPTHNGMATLPGVLEAIARQRVDFAVEIVAADTASTDGTDALLRARAARVIHVAAGTFNHGLTRNLAIAASRGEFVVLLSQDAEPANDAWLTRLVAPLCSRPNVAGTFARQQPRPGSGAIARHYHANWPGSAPEPHVSRLESLDVFERMAPDARMAACTFDNVCSCIRRDVWKSHPFPKTTIAEDLEWSRQVLLAGFEIEYVPDAVVLHSHERSPWYEFQRTRLLHQRLHALFGVRTIPTLPALARAVASSSKLHLQCRRSASAAAASDGLTRALALAVAWPVGQYVGGLAASRGWAQNSARNV